MTVPKQKHTKGKRNMRRMHLFMKAPSLSVCPKCGKPVLPHTVCSNCGYYKGVEVIDVLKDLNKKERKQKEKEIAMKGQDRETEEKKPLEAGEFPQKS